MKPVKNLRVLAQKINIRGQVSFDEPLAPYTTFRVGGPADVFIRPNDPKDIVSVLSLARREELPVFILGGGANILVSDRGIRGFVICMPALSGISISGAELACWSGNSMSEVSWNAAVAGLGGLEFIYSMPGTVGGALWMNARCYGSSIAEVLDWVEIIDRHLTIVRVKPDLSAFAYKRSPFQTSDEVILRAGFRLHPADSVKLFREMEEHRADRERKGHFIAPSAGSVFKNNHAFGSPTGKIIDSLGLRGHAIGGAKVSDYHANMIINSGGATATDIDALVRFVARRVSEELGLELEREVLPVGDWEGSSP